MTEHNKIDVFISRKSQDAALARKLYAYLTSKGLNVFESDETLPRLGNSDYRKAIDNALDSCNHMIVMGSSGSNITSSWVEAEWGFYIAEKRAGRKRGNILTVITDSLTIGELPPSLRNYEVIYFREYNFEKILAYVDEKTAFQSTGYHPKWFLSTKWIATFIGAFLIVAVTATITYQKNQPVDITIFTKPDPSLRLYPAYPTFSGGELSVFIGSKEERKQLLNNGELSLKQIPAAYIGKKVAVQLHSKYWKTATDSIVLDSFIRIDLIPDGSLGKVYGRVIDQNANPVSGVTLKIDTDTTFQNTANGIFRLSLPQKMQKESYRIVFEKKGYKIKDITYWPVSGYADAVLEKQ